MFETSSLQVYEKCWFGGFKTDLTLFICSLHLLSSTALYNYSIQLLYSTAQLLY